VVNNSDAQGNFQAFLELRKESNPREQGRHSHWNPARGSPNQVPGGWEFVGDNGADGDGYVCDIDSLARLEKFDSYRPMIKS